MPDNVNDNRKTPSVADMAFALMTTPGFNSLTAETELKDNGKQNIHRALSDWLHRQDSTANAPSDPGWVQGINAVIWGPPGCGKTQGVQAAIQAMGYRAWKKDLTRVSPEDLTGIPRPVKEGKQMFTVKAPDRFFWNLSKAKKAVLVLDDLINAPKAVQGGALGLVLDREFDDGVGGSHYIRHVPVIAMSNFGDAATTSDMLTPMANRFVHIFTGPQEDATKYWTNGGKAPITLDPSRADAVRGEWNERYLKAWALCSAFVVEYGGRVWDNDPQDITRVEQHAWLTPRTLELAARCIAAAEHYDLKDDRLLEGAIGKLGARKLMDFRRSLNLPSPEDVYAHRVNWKLLAPSGQVVLLQKAANDCSSSEQLQAVFDGITAVREANKADDLTVLALEVLKRRAAGAITTRPVDHPMAVLIRGFVDPALRQYRAAGWQRNGNVHTRDFGGLGRAS